MKITTLAICTALGLAGCATFSDIGAGLDRLNGQPISEAIRELGYPSSQQYIDGDKIYIWGSSRSFSMPTSSTAQTNGQVGGVAYSQTTTATSYENVNYNCTIRIIVDGKSDLIKAHDGEGNIGGCAQYANRLNKFKK